VLLKNVAFSPACSEWRAFRNANSKLFMPRYAAAHRNSHDNEETSIGSAHAVESSAIEYNAPA